MDKVEVSLSTDMRRILDDALAAGEFGSLDEALNECIRVWKMDKDDAPLRVAKMQVAVERSLRDTRPGIPIEEVKRRLEKKFAEYRIKADDAAA